MQGENDKAAPGGTTYGGAEAIDKGTGVERAIKSSPRSFYFWPTFAS